MMYVPDELVRVCQALSEKEQFQLLVELSKEPVNAKVVDKEKVDPLVNAALVERWTIDFKEYYYEVTTFGKAILKALASVWNPKKVT